ncbi:hypothetical protein WUBG_08321, partial [Wuchereria bancrofti]
SLIILQVGGLSELILQQNDITDKTISIDKINDNIANAVLGLINTVDNGLFFCL